MFSLIVQSFVPTTNGKPSSPYKKHTICTTAAQLEGAARMICTAVYSSSPVVVDPIEASKNAVEAMPRVTISHSHDQNCSICFQEFMVGEEAPKVPCSCKGSYFHPLCLQTWLGLNASCPLCRFHVELMPDQVKTKTKTKD